MRLVLGVAHPFGLLAWQAAFGESPQASPWGRSGRQSPFHHTSSDRWSQCPMRWAHRVQGSSSGVSGCHSVPRRKATASCSSAGERSCRSMAVNRAVEVRMLCSDLEGGAPEQVHAQTAETGQGATARPRDKGWHCASLGAYVLGHAPFSLQQPGGPQTAHVAHELHRLCGSGRQEPSEPRQNLPLAEARSGPMPRGPGHTHTCRSCGCRVSTNNFCATALAKASATT